MSENAQRRAQELECLVCMFDVDGSLIIDDADAAADHAQLLAAGLQDDSLYPELQISVKLPYRIHEIFLVLTLPRAYPSAEALRARVRSETMPSAAVEDLSEMCAHLCNSRAGEEAALHVIMSLNEAMEDYEAAEVAVMSEMTEAAAVVAAGSKNTEYQFDSRESVLGRRCIWSHHICCPFKRRYIQQCARELRLGGWSKIGFPGVIIVEGGEMACQEFCSRLQRLRWKALVVRGEEQVPVPAGSQIASLRLLPFHFVELPPSGMSTLAEGCRTVGLHALFMTAMKIYS